MCTRGDFEGELIVKKGTVPAFWLDRTEVTNAAFAEWLNGQTQVRLLPDKRVVLEDGRTLLVDLGPPTGSIRHEAGRYQVRPGDEEKPVVLVTWLGAERYCASQGKRLPTEMEWERAARHPGGGPFPWGNGDPSCNEVRFGQDRRYPACPAAAPGPSPVGASSLDRSTEGVADLAGNVQEWVWDSVPGMRNQHIVRGGDFEGSVMMLRSGFKERYLADKSLHSIGFRCAKDER